MKRTDWRRSGGICQKRKKRSTDKAGKIGLLCLLLLFLCVTAGLWSGALQKKKPDVLSIQMKQIKEIQQADTSGDWRLILVNADHRIPDDYQVDLEELDNGEKVDSRIYPDLQSMFHDASAVGLSMYVREGYRTEKEQQQIMEEKIEAYKQEGSGEEEAVKLAEQYVALPGTSEHQLGLSVDINAEKESDSNQVYKWLNVNAWKYGFIKRYPEDKTDITGINNEPWHYRYVGKEAAKEMKEKNLCLEEYCEEKK